MGVGGGVSKSLVNVHVKFAGQLTVSDGVVVRSMSCCLMVAVQ